MTCYYAYMSLINRMVLNLILLIGKQGKITFPLGQFLTSVTYVLFFCWSAFKLFAYSLLKKNKSVNNTEIFYELNLGKVLRILQIIIK